MIGTSSPASEEAHEKGSHGLSNGRLPPRPIGVDGERAGTESDMEASEPVSETKL